MSASAWGDGRLRVEGRADAMGALLGVPRSKVVRVPLPVGKVVGNGPRREKKPFNERAWFDRRGG